MKGAWFKKRGQRIKPEDFIPVYDKAPQTRQQMGNVLKQISASYKAHKDRHSGNNDR
tara:strand:+ start:1185 stop:1355 length:171 start_codon:yes stop_codon:yes gene_type:complete